MFAQAFDPKKREILIDVVLTGPLGASRLRFLLDTGTPVSIIDSAAVDALGYGARMGTEVSRLAGVDGVQAGYRLKVDRLEALGFSVEQYEFSCHDFEAWFAIDGLIGMDLLEGRVLTIDGVRGVVTVGG